MSGNWIITLAVYTNIRCVTDEYVCCILVYTRSTFPAHTSHRKNHNLFIGKNVYADWIAAQMQHNYNWKDYGYNGLIARCTNLRGQKAMGHNIDYTTINIIYRNTFTCAHNPFHCGQMGSIFWRLYTFIYIWYC